MWKYASEMVPDLESLNEVDGRGQYKLNDELYERCLTTTQEKFVKQVCKYMEPKY